MNTKPVLKPFFTLLILMLVSCSSNNPKKIIGLNTAIHHDDFEYYVTSYSVAKQIGEGMDPVQAKGNFYIVGFRVRNNAMRVNHLWDNSIAYLIDENGTVYENDTAAQQKLNEISPFGWSENYKTPHKTDQSTRLVFDVPVSVTKPYLMVRGETLMGDFFDGSSFTKIRVKLF